MAEVGRTLQDPPQWQYGVVMLMMMVCDGAWEVEWVETSEVVCLLFHWDRRGRCEGNPRTRRRCCRWLCCGQFPSLVCPVHCRPWILRWEREMLRGECSEERIVRGS